MSKPPMNTSFFSGAHNFSMEGTTFSNVRGNQTSNHYDYRKTVKDSYNRNEVNNYGSYNTTYSNSTITNHHDSRGGPRNPGNRPYPRSEASAPADIGEDYGDEGFRDSSDSDSDDSEGRKWREISPARYEDKHTSRRRPKGRPRRQEMDPSGYPGQESSHYPQEDSFPSRGSRNPQSSRNRPPPQRRYHPDDPDADRTPYPAYGPEGYHAPHPHYPPQAPYAPPGYGPPLHPPGAGYSPYSTGYPWQQPPPHPYQNHPPPWQQPQSGPPPQNLDTEPHGQYAPRSTPNQRPHHSYYPQSDDQQSSAPLSANWGSNNPFRTKTAPPSTTAMRRPPGDYPDIPQGSGTRGMSEDVEMAPVSGP